MLEQVRENNFAIFFARGGGLCQRGNGLVHSDVGASLFDFFDLIQVIKYKIGFDFGNFREGSDCALYHILMFTFQKFNKIRCIWRDEIGVHSAEFIHDIHTVAVDVFVVVPHVFGNLTNTCNIVTRGKVTRQIKVGRSVATGLLVTKAV